MRHTALLVVLAAALGGCEAFVGEPPLRPGEDEPGRAPLRPEARLCPEPEPGLVPARRLSSDELRATVRDLFEGRVDASTKFPETIIHSGYRTYAEHNTVSADGAQAIADAAAAIGRDATTDMTALLGCAPGTSAADACVRGWLEGFLERAYRRVPTTDEHSSMQRLYADLIDDGYSPTEGVASVIEAIVQSPGFLYRSEVGQGGQPGDVVPLDGYEVASRLSYFLWGTMPDERLLELARRGALGDRSTVEAEADRMAHDVRAARQFATFVEDWLELHRLEGRTKDRTVFPAWNDQTADHMRSEVGAFVEEVMLRDDGTLTTLLSAPYTVANGPLAAIYGATPPADPSAFERIALDRNQRAGLLTQTAFLASHAGLSESSPVQRGVFVRRNMLCQELELPAGLMVSSPAPDPGRTTRERFVEHRAAPFCASCHQFMDPIGFGLEHYDAIGAYRTTESDHPIDATGELLAAGDTSGPFDGAVQLAGRLAGSELVRDCVADQALSFAQGRELRATTSEEAGDECTMGYVRSRFAEANGDLRGLLAAIATSDAFLHRRIPQ